MVTYAKRGTVVRYLTDYCGTSCSSCVAAAFQNGFSDYGIPSTTRCSIRPIANKLPTEFVSVSSQRLSVLKIIRDPATVANEKTKKIFQDWICNCVGKIFDWGKAMG